MKLGNALGLGLMTGSLLLQGCGGSGDDDPADADASAGDMAVVESPLQTGAGAGDGDDLVDAVDPVNAGDAPGTDPGVDPGIGAPADTRAIAGLYDVSEVDEGLLDVLYLEIASDGGFTVYDYDGDDFDQGDNCYFAETGRFESLGGDRYRVFPAGDEGVVVDADAETNDVELVRSSDGLRVSYVDTFDEDEDGDTAETLVFVYPSVTNLSSTDFNSCVGP